MERWLMSARQLKIKTRELLKSLLEMILGSKFRAHRIPFGPIKGRKVFLSPQISLRMWFGVDEPWIAQLRQKLLKPSDIVFDLGAHVGYTTVLFADTLQGSGEVHAFEILPSTADHLRKTIKANDFKNVTIHNVGLGAEEGVFDLPVGPTAMTSLLANRQEDQTTERCKVVRMDDYRRENGLPGPDLIKMDIERAEIDCLQGSLELIKEFRPKMIIAFHSKALLQQGITLLTSLDYQLHDKRGQLTIDSLDRINDRFNNSILCLPN
jgi:FkbM family methyltransferase